MSVAPVSLTMDRLGEKDEIFLAQATSQFLRCLCFQKSINYVLSDAEDSEIHGWIHEESSLFGRTFSACFSGFRETKYVQHAGPPPAAIVSDNSSFGCQSTVASEGISEEERRSNVVATHQKTVTCTDCFKVSDFAIPVCNCFPLPYLETKDANGRVLGRTQYVCDMCCAVPKFNVNDAAGTTKYYIRPDTCCCGTCVACKCGGKGIFRVPFIIRDPKTKEPLSMSNGQDQATITNLWTGLKNEFCTNKENYKLSFPQGATAEEKTVLMGSAILVDFTQFEQNE